jgi:hypothetical protein
LRRSQRTAPCGRCSAKSRLTDIYPSPFLASRRGAMVSSGNSREHRHQAVSHLVIWILNPRCFSSIPIVLLQLFFWSLISVHSRYGPHARRVAKKSSHRRFQQLRRLRGGQFVRIARSVTRQHLRRRGSLSFWTWFRYGCMERTGSHTGSPGCSIKLRPRPGRESHCGIVLEAQSELDDAPVQREASELRLGRVRRKDFHLPAAQVLCFSQIDQPAQLQPDFDLQRMRERQPTCQNGVKGCGPAIRWKHRPSG